MKLTVTQDLSTRSARIDITGDLDYGHTGRLLNTVSELLSAETSWQELHLNFAELTFIDSTGLSALFQVHRKASAVGARLFLDDRPAHLDRILDITGVLEHLTSGPAVAAENPDETEIG
ncbi:STAS domain-containing protein [Mycolicibacterium sp. XJ662]